MRRPVPISDFGVDLGYSGGEAILAVRGEIDLATAPDLASLMEAVMGQGHQEVVLDLAEVDFMDAQGLRVIALGVARLEPRGGELTIRAPSVMVRRMLAITGLDTVVRLQEAAPGRGRPGLDTRVQLGPEQSTATPGANVAVRSRSTGSARAVVIQADDVVDRTLRMAVELARATVGGADGVSVSLARHGRLSTVAASDETISDMDADQYATGEGPCVDASVTGRWFHVNSLEQERRWPAFIPRARRLGINAILSTPLIANDRPVGALNIYSRSTGAFTNTEQELAALFATEASIMLGEAGADVVAEVVDGRVDPPMRDEMTTGVNDA